MPGPSRHWTKVPYPQNNTPDRVAPFRYHRVTSTSDIVYLLDDEPSILRALRRLLASDGIHAELFSDPIAFLAHARIHSMRLAVIDVRMPQMSGFEVLRELRRFSPATHVIIMTGTNDADDPAKASAAGACAFFLKPLQGDPFLKAVRDALA
jgi:FixJ family two-component response regulator